MAYHPNPITALVATDADAAKKKILAAFRRHGGTTLTGARGQAGKGGADRLPPSIKGVAEEYNVHVSTVRAWCRALGIGTFAALAKALGESPKRVVQEG